MSFMKKQRTRVLLLAAVNLFLLCFPFGGSAMQPPPPPLNISQFQMLIKEADVIAVGKIDQVHESASDVEAVLAVEKILKGGYSGPSVSIRERRNPDHSKSQEAVSTRNGSKQMIAASVAGPSFYHGRYRPGMRVVVLLEKVKDTDQYRPLGSGTYNRHLCEFIIEEGGIKTLYFTFADDLAKDAASEQAFIRFIEKTVNQGQSRSILDILCHWF